jgi:hypothetical protein
MTWFPDLSPIVHFSAAKQSPLAVGWLSPEYPFSSGEISETVFEKLCQLLQNPWCPIRAVGGHRCEFCRFTGGASSHYKGYTVTSYSLNSLYVPGNSVIYLAPESIAHYIDAHGYCPPEEFCSAVMKCPEGV